MSRCPQGIETRCLLARTDGFEPPRISAVHLRYRAVDDLHDRRE